MKKILFLLSIFLFILTACDTNKTENLKNAHKSVMVSSSSRIAKTTEKSAVTAYESTMQTKTAVTEIPKAKKLNLGETDQWSFNSRSKFIYFTDYGRYYPVGTSGLKAENFDGVCDDIARYSAVYDLCLDDGSEKTVLSNTRNCVSYYCDGNYVYIYKYDDYDTHDSDGIYKLYKGSLTKLADYPDNGYISAVCFTESQIYYSIFDEKKSAVYKMDYDGSNIRHIFDNQTKIWDMTIYNDKIWFERSYDMYQIHGLAYYDMKTSVVGQLKENHMGYINNDYMYYFSSALYRMNLSDFKREEVIKLDDYLTSFDFYRNNILYSTGDSLYRMNDNENTLIISAEDFCENEDYQIRDIQCQDDRIFIKMGDGAFYQCIMEIDIDGNVIEVIHED